MVTMSRNKDKCRCLDVDWPRVRGLLRIMCCLRLTIRIELAALQIENLLDNRA